MSSLVGDEKKGEKIFKTKCAQCHSIEAGEGHKQGIFIFDIMMLIQL